MGSPVSAILSNLVMEFIEETAMATALHQPKWWYRYVDDSNVCLRHEHLTEFHDHLNSINEHIQFTVEKENNGSIAFLDTQITRDENGSISISVYRKATHTDKYLHFDSHHPVQHKRAVVRTLLDRAENISSSDIIKITEQNRVFETLKNNGYPEPFISSCKRQRSSSVHCEPKGLVILPYIKGISEKIANILKKQSIKVAYKPIRTIQSMFKKPKDQPDKDSSTAVVYKINCVDCEKSYIGQTNRALKTRTKEHQRAFALQDKNSLLTKHHQDTKHVFNFDNVKIIDHCQNHSGRLFLEAWHSIRDKNSINEHIQVPNVYNVLA